MSSRNRVSKEKKKREGKDKQENAPNEPRTHVCSFGIMRETRQDMIRKWCLSQIKKIIL